MLHMILNNKGLTIVESLIAVMLTAVAIIGLLTMQPLGLQSAGKADSMSRATELMQRELESVEGSIMCIPSLDNVTALVKDNVSETVGNETLFINTSFSAAVNGTRIVRVRVTWPGNTSGVSSSMIVTKQSTFCN